VTFVTVFAAGLKSSIAKTIDDNFKSDVILQNSDGFSPIPRDAVAAARDVDGVSDVSAITYGSGEYQGNQIRVAGVDPRNINGAVSLDFVEGTPETLSSLTDREAVVDSNWADSNGLDVGDTVRIRTPLEKTAIYTITGEVKGALDLFGKMLVRDSTLDPLFGADQPSIAFIRTEHGASSATVQRNLERALALAYPTVEVRNQQQLKERQESDVNTLLLLVYALLSLAVIVSLFGIVNTLALSIHERTRELGMLRAVGMSRRQVRTMVRYEAVITALIGAILGMVLGVLMAALVSRPLADDGFTLSYPIPVLILLLALAAFAGVLAAIGPARRASRIDVLRALAYE
jgi:putative ABC transport system permease protein